MNKEYHITDLDPQFELVCAEIFRLEAQLGEKLPKTERQACHARLGDEKVKKLAADLATRRAAAARLAKQMQRFRS